MTSVTSLDGPLATSDVALLPEWLAAKVLDPLLSTNLVALLVGVWVLTSDAGPMADRVAFLQQRDVAWGCNLDRKTVFEARPGKVALIAQAREHGLIYTAGIPRTTVETRKGKVGEAGAYRWAVQDSPTGEGSLTRLNPEVAVSTEIQESHEDPPVPCGGNLHALDVEGLTALTRPDGPFWTPKRAGLRAWRLCLILLLTRGLGPMELTGTEAARLLGSADSSSGRRCLSALRREGLVTGVHQNVFNVDPVLTLRRQYMEDYRRDCLLHPSERPTRKDVGGPLDNAALSRDYMSTMTAYPARMAAQSFLANRQVLLAKADDLVGLPHGCNADPTWLQAIRSLSKTTTLEYLSAGGAIKPFTMNPSGLSGPHEAPDPVDTEAKAALLVRLRQMSQMVNTLGVRQKVGYGTQLPE